jgi:uncharacterized membrane protein
MKLQRLLRHLLATSWTARRAFPEAALARIEEAIRRSEQRHGGQVRFAVEAALDPASVWRGTSATERALEAFSSLRVWDTEHNNGVLVYLLLADHDVEIVADRGIHQRVGAQGWEAICHEMEAQFRGGRFLQGVLDGVERITRHLEAHYPARGGANELPDRPVVL